MKIINNGRLNTPDMQLQCKCTRIMHVCDTLQKSFWCIATDLKPSAQSEQFRHFLGQGEGNNTVKEVQYGKEINVRMHLDSLLGRAFWL